MSNYSVVTGYKQVREDGETGASCHIQFWDKNDLQIAYKLAFLKHLFFYLFSWAVSMEMLIFVSSPLRFVQKLTWKNKPNFKIN